MNNPLHRGWSDSSKSARLSSTGVHTKRFYYIRDAVGNATGSVQRVIAWPGTYRLHFGRSNALTSQPAANWLSVTLSSAPFWLCPDVGRCGGDRRLSGWLLLLCVVLRFVLHFHLTRTR